MKKIIWYIIGIFAACSIIEYIEFLILKTDQTVLAENVICKFFCIAVIFTVLKRLHWKWSDIGFRKRGITKGIAYGLALGFVCYAVSYAAEFAILMLMGKEPHLSFYITNFGLNQQAAGQFTWIALIICIFGNLINVWAEEGLFRGLFYHYGKSVLSDKKANLLQALLFGLWHVVMVCAGIADGSMRILEAAVMAVGYVLLSGILAYGWGLCAAASGAVWISVSAHFFNNLIGNVLHTVTASGADELQIVRVVLSTLLSTGIIWIAVRRHK